MHNVTVACYKFRQGAHHGARMRCSQRRFRVVEPHGAEEQVTRFFVVVGVYCQHCSTFCAKRFFFNKVVVAAVVVGVRPNKRPKTLSIHDSLHFRVDRVRARIARAHMRPATHMCFNYCISLARTAASTLRTTHRHTHKRMHRTSAHNGCVIITLPACVCVVITCMARL